MLAYSSLSSLLCCPIRIHPRSTVAQLLAASFLRHRPRIHACTLPPVCFLTASMPSRWPLRLYRLCYVQAPPEYLHRRTSTSGSVCLTRLGSNGPQQGTHTAASAAARLPQADSAGARCTAILRCTPAPSVDPLQHRRLRWRPRSLPLLHCCASLTLM